MRCDDIHSRFSERRFGDGRFGIGLGTACKEGREENGRDGLAGSAPDCPGMERALGFALGERFLFGLYLYCRVGPSFVF